MEDNEKLEVNPSGPDEATTESPSDEQPATDEPAEEQPPEKPKKFWERHPTAKKALQGAGVVAVLLGLSALLQHLCGESSMPSLDQHDEPDDTTFDGHPNEEAYTEPLQEEVSPVQESAVHEPITFPRKGGIVNLPITQHASPQKREEAARNGIELGEHQTTRRDHECTR